MVSRIGDRNNVFPSRATLFQKVRMPLLIVLSGLPGVGKSALARELASRLGAVHVRIDSIEQALRDSGLLRGPMNDAGYQTGYAVAEDNRRLGRIVIADSVNPLKMTRDAWIATADRAQARAVEVEVVCSDAVEHRRRVETRTADISRLKLPSWPEVVSREYHCWERNHLVVDTTGRSIADCVKEIMEGLPI
jgi:predicted kinase